MIIWRQILIRRPEMVPAPKLLFVQKCGRVFYTDNQTRRRARGAWPGLGTPSTPPLLGSKNRTPSIKSWVRPRGESNGTPKGMDSKRVPSAFTFLATQCVGLLGFSFICARTREQEEGFKASEHVLITTIGPSSTITAVDHGINSCTKTIIWNYWLISRLSRIFSSVILFPTIK